MSIDSAKITTHCFSHVGQRGENQDRFAILESPGDGSRLLVLADGLGGHTGGSLAAETVVATAERCWRSRCAGTAMAETAIATAPQSETAAGSETQTETESESFRPKASIDKSPEEFLKLLVRECHSAVRGAGWEHALDPHSTIAALLLQDGQAVSVHAGDSRVMQYSEGAFVDRTLDHSVAQLHALRGTITDDEIADHPDQNKLFAQVGGPTAPEPEIKHWDLAAGRRFVLCSDGFWEIFRHDEIVELFASDNPEAELKDRFETKLKQLKRHDNTTAILAEIPESRVRHRRRRSAHPAVSVAVAAMVLALHAANVAVGQSEGGADGDPGQGEGERVTATQGEVPGVPDGGEPEISPIRLQPSDFVLDLPIEPGEAIAEVVAEELRQRGQLGGDDSLVNAGGPSELGGLTVLRMRQEHRGIPVFAAQVVASTSGERIVRIAGDSTPDIRLDSTVPVNDYASTVALAEMLTNLDIAPQDGGALVVFPAENEGRLAWSGPAIIEQDQEQDVELDPQESPEPSPPPSLEQIFIDAVSGEILLRLPLLRQALDRRIHDFSQACRDAGIRGPMNARRAMARAPALLVESPLVRSEAVGGWHRNAERLFDTLGAYYRFLRLVLNIDSIDDSGKPLVGYIGARFDERTPGIPQCSGDEFMAFWMPTDAMILTDAGLDFPELIGHEATHGLIDHGSGLIYQYESGALHESIADALGIAFRGWREDGARQDLEAEIAMDAGNWQIRAPSEVIRDFRAPTSVVLAHGTPLPDHYDNYMHLSADFDNGGVHVNSSIMNHGFYLLAAGGRHTRLQHDPEVEGIGVLKAARIFGAAAAWLLRPASDFEDARHAFAHAAEAIHGEYSMEWVAVHTAMDAIGIPGAWERPPVPEPPEPVAPEPPEPVAPEPTMEPEPPETTESAAEPESPETPEPTVGPEPPVPAPDPTVAPPPVEVQASVEESGPAQDLSRNRPALSGQTLVLLTVAALALAGAAIVVYAYRPGRASPAHWQPAIRTSRDRGTATPNSKSPAAPAQDTRSPATATSDSRNPTAAASTPGIAGTLQPAEGTSAIPLPQSLLDSAEGLVIGRAASICHVALTGPAVSRRHLRLRLADGTIMAEDLNSTAGTRLDGAALEPFHPQPVVSGQTLKLAKLVYTIDIA